MRLTIKIFFTSVIAIFLALFSPAHDAVHADQFAANATYQVCFTPKQNCTREIVDAINNAKQSVLMQAYTITSYPIENALIRAKNRGVEIKIIADKNQYLQFSKPILYLAMHQIPIWIDYNLAGLAHNKVIIIDDKTVITGSFNFTKAAQKSNAENVLIINDDKLAKKYTKNWHRHKSNGTQLDLQAIS